MKLIKNFKKWSPRESNLFSSLYLLIYDLKIDFNRDNRTKTEHLPKQNKRKIHFVYFSCKKHFEYLFASLKSLEKLDLRYLGNVYLYIDKNDPLSNKEIKHISGLKITPFIKKAHYRLSWGGPNLIINELNAFKEISKQINEHDYIAKLDSDILFISDRIFKEVIKSKDSLIGQKCSCYYPFVYTQGGCYFLKNSIVPKITSQKLKRNIKEVLKKTKNKFDFLNFPEDATIYTLVKNKTDKIKFIDFYLPSKNVHDLTKKDKEEYSVIHFERCRDEMLEVAKKL